MQRTGGPDVRVKYFDVPPMEEDADIRDREPIIAVLDPPPSANWGDVFVDLVDAADPMLLRSHPALVGGTIVFRPTPYEAKGTCILLKDLVIQVNDAYRQRGFGNKEHATARQKNHEALRDVVKELNSGSN